MVSDPNLMTPNSNTNYLPFSHHHSNLESYNNSYTQNLLQIKPLQNSLTFNPYSNISFTDTHSVLQQQGNTFQNENSTTTELNFTRPFESLKNSNEDSEFLRLYSNGQIYANQNKFLTSTPLTVATTPVTNSYSYTNPKSGNLFNPIYQNNFYEPKDYHSNYGTNGPNFQQFAEFQDYNNFEQLNSKENTNGQKFQLANATSFESKANSNFPVFQKNLNEQTNFYSKFINLNDKEFSRNENNDLSGNKEFYSSDKESSNDSSDDLLNDKTDSILSHENDAKIHPKGQSSNQKKTRTKDKYRVVYNELQRTELEKEFNFSKYITSRRKSELASVLDLSQRQIKIWFQNRRAKDRKVLKKRKNEQSQSNSSENSFRMAIHNVESIHNINTMANYNLKPDQYVWNSAHETVQNKTSSEINSSSLSVKNIVQVNPEFSIYQNQNNLNYGI
ncbi:unnamed protein product [Brachionus calyciflorus]|uniref:Homeobox domain-containing protein n=1 Tax=Brachionus calyciflorus TaxID=104777 RepID=A0A813LXR7_9BILA|nr:unnamed protein product [Brachionus calyciflorus]